MTYYHYIPFILLLNALAFYIPHLIWKHLEGGVVKRFYSEEANKIHIDGENEQILQQNSQQFMMIMNSLRWYHGKFVFCQFLNIVTVFVIFFIDDAVFQERYLNYGLQNLDWNPMCDVFPTRTGCSLSTGCTSPGASCRNDGLCDLNHNQYNQYIFLLLWYWYIILFVIGFLQLMLEVFCILVPSFRFTLIKRNLPKGATVNMQFIQTIDQWFLLFQISRNMESNFFYEFLKRASRKEEAVKMTEIKSESHERSEILLREEEGNSTQNEEPLQHQDDDNN